MTVEKTHEFCEMIVQEVFQINRNNHGKKVPEITETIVKKNLEITETIVGKNRVFRGTIVNFMK